MGVLANSEGTLGKLVVPINKLARRDAETTAFDLAFPIVVGSGTK